MRKGTVTGEVKDIIVKLGLRYGSAYSDNYVRGRVGVKLVGVYLTEAQKEIVKNEMIKRGFTFHYIRENDNGYQGCNGTRFCFTKN